MERNTLRTRMPALIAGHLPRNARQFGYRVYDGTPQPSSLGLRIDPPPFTGTVIAKDDDALIVKIGRIQFAVVDRALATLDPEPGTKVQVVPYARHDFAGTRLDAPVEERLETEDGQTHVFSTVILGDRTVKLPLPPPHCPALADLIQHLEQRPAPDGFRKIVHLLVDAHAHAFSCVDPAPGNPIDTPPEVAFHVDTAKFAGLVAILYDRGPGLYAVELRRDGATLSRIDDVDFTSLGRTLEDLIDDGHWRRIQVTALRRPRRARH